MKQAERNLLKYSPSIHLGGVRKIEKCFSTCGQSLVELSKQWPLKYLEGVLMLCLFFTSRWQNTRQTVHVLKCYFK